MGQLERHGGGAMMDRAFAGFGALPSPKSCWEILGVSKSASLDDISRTYRSRAKEAHPDNGGSNSVMAELNKARDEALGIMGR
jgi:DnaJ-class molecular chaperone